LLADGITALERSGGEAYTTNNRMELTAAAAALEAIASGEISPLGEVVTVYTDSQYLQKGISAWIAGWKKKGWRSSSGSPVKNQDLWLTLDELNHKVTVQWRWVKGHAGDFYNERCDALVQEAIRSVERGGATSTSSS
jgi:ribonuclease HI